MESVMPLQALLQNNHFGPDEIKVLTTAFEEALSALHLTDREDPATLIVAKRIIELAKRGERDPTRLRDGALMSLRGQEVVTARIDQNTVRRAATRANEGA
jgi:hypothetical protein